MLLLSSADIFQNKLFQKKLSRDTLRVSNSLNPDQDRQTVGPDLDPNSLQKLSADHKSHLYQGKSDLGNFLHKH